MNFCGSKTLNMFVVFLLFCALIFGLHENFTGIKYFYRCVFWQTNFSQNECWNIFLKFNFRIYLCFVAYWNVCLLSGDWFRIILAAHKVKLDDPHSFSETGIGPARDPSIYSLAESLVEWEYRKIGNISFCIFKNRPQKN